MTLSRKTAFFWGILLLLAAAAGCGGGGGSSSNPPPRPEGLQASAGDTRVTLSWPSVSGADTYHLYWSTTSGTNKYSSHKIADVSSPYVHGALTNGTTYHYVLTAANGGGESPESQEVWATPGRVPSPPTGLAAHSGDSQLQISWDHGAGAETYHLYWGTAPGVTKTTGTRIANVSSPYTHTGLANETTYYYVVTSVNAFGESAESAEVSGTPGRPPSPPSGVALQAGDGWVRVSWNASSWAASYNLYWSTTPGVTKISGTKIAGVASPYQHTGLTDGTTYYYVVTAANSFGESAESSEVSGTPSAPPPAPTGLDARPGDSQVRLSWNAVSGATSYNLYWSISPGVTKSSGTKIANVASPYTHVGLTNWRTYYYVVTAQNGFGESPESSAVSDTPGIPPDPPSGMSALAGTGEVRVSWNHASWADSYNLYWSNSPGVTKSTGTKISGAATPYTHTGLTAGKTYYYVTTAVNRFGEGGESSEVAAVPGAPPSAPAGLAVQAAVGQLRVTWNAVSGASSYNLYWGNSPGVTKTTGTKISGATTPYTHTGLTAGTPYYYVATAVNAFGESAESGEASGTPGALPPAPSGLKTFAGSRQARITWNDVSGASSYNLYWSTTPGVTKANGTKVPVTASNYLHTGLTNGTAYYYVVCAVNAFGEGAESAQTSATPGLPSLAWSKQWGTAGNDVGQALALDGSGNIYITGYTEGNLDGKTNAGGKDVFLTKYNSSGMQQWTALWGTAGDDVGNGVALDSAGNIYVTGSTPDSTSPASAATVLLKFDSAGNRQWTQILQNGYGVDGRAVATDGQGNFYPTGNDFWDLDTDPDNWSIGDWDIFFARYDSSGNKIKTRLLGTTQPDNGLGIAADGNGNIYIVGHTGGSFPGQTNAGLLDILVLKVDALGALQWARQLGTPKEESARGVALDGSGNIYAAGYFQGPGTLDGNTIDYGNDSFLLKYNASGSKLWTRIVGAISEARGVAADQNGNAYVAGFSTGKLDDDNPGSLGAGYDIYTVKFDAWGTKLWGRLAATAGEDEGYAVGLDSDGNVYVTGSTTGALGGANAGQKDIFLLKYSAF